MVFAAPVVPRLARFGIVRTRVHLRITWRAIAPLVIPNYAETPLQRAIHLQTPVRPPRVTFVNGHIDTFTLDEMRGYGVLLFFGNHACSGRCPHVLRQFTRVKAALGEHASRVRFVMIGVESDGDQTYSLLRLVRSYDADFMALTADLPTVAAFARKHGVTVLRAPHLAGSTFVPLTPYILYLNPEGLWTMCFPPDMSAEEIADEIIYSLGF